MSRRHGPQPRPERQLAQLKQQYPDGEVKLARGQVIWTGVIQPSPASRAYRVRVAWRPRQRAKVSVLSPRLRDREGLPPPHLFPDGSLCLHLPKEWDSTMSVADTVIPWTSSWLLFYELWLATGEWLGGGHGTPAAEKSDVDQLVG